MKKIFAGVAGLLLVVATVSGAAYALFTDTVVISGISVTTGNADLQVFNPQEGETGGFVDSWDTGLELENLFPGYSANTTLTLKNNSASDIGLNVKAQLTDFSEAEDWDDLNEAVEVKVDFGLLTTNWKTLKQWSANPVNLPGNPLAHLDERGYTVSVRVKQNTGNEIADMSLSDLVFTLTGTQDVP